MKLIYKKAANLGLVLSLVTLLLALVMRTLVDSSLHDPQEQIEVFQRERGKALALLQSSCDFEVTPVEVIKNANGIGFTEIFKSDSIPPECRAQLADVSNRFKLAQHYRPSETVKEQQNKPSPYP